MTTPTEALKLALSACQSALTLDERDGLGDEIAGELRAAVEKVSAALAQPPAPQSEALKLALEALQYMHSEKCDYMRRNNLGDPLREDASRLALPAMEAARAALAQAEQPTLNHTPEWFGMDPPNHQQPDAGTYLFTPGKGFEKLPDHFPDAGKMVQAEQTAEQAQPEPITLDDVLDALNVFNEPRPSEGGGPWTADDAIAVTHLPAFLTVCYAAWYAAPPAAQPGTWSLYVADMIAAYLKWPVGDPRVDAVAGIIERRRKFDAAHPAAQPQPWQPIETAPKDGTEVLLYAPDRRTYGAWAEPSAKPRILYRDGFAPEEEWDEFEPYWASWDGGFTAEHPPTHWMPLPAAPTGNGIGTPAQMGSAALGTAPGGGADRG